MSTVVLLALLAVWCVAFAGLLALAYYLIYVYESPWDKLQRRRHG